jgi:hypothetical protein
MKGFSIQQKLTVNYSDLSGNYKVSCLNSLTAYSINSPTVVFVLRFLNLHGEFK